MFLLSVKRLRASAHRMAVRWLRSDAVSAREDVPSLPTAEPVATPYLRRAR